MHKNKYDLAEDVAWTLTLMLLSELESCKCCFMEKECRSNREEEKVLCSSVAKLTEAIEKKYLR
jgi:hypothetical protein